MTFSIKYKPLFQVNILHKYYLNKGTQDYLTMSEAEQYKQLICYNLSNLFTVLPSAKSRQKIDGHQLVFKTNTSGFIIWTKISESNENFPFISLADDLEFTFLLKLKNHTFFNFSNLEFESADKLFFFSNKRLSTESPTFPLIKKSGNNSTVNNNYTLNNQSATNELQELTSAERNNLFGLVKIHIKGSTPSLNVTNSQSKIRTPSQVFEIVFENRKTIWRYIFNEDQVVENTDDVKKEGGNAKHLITKQSQPLTYCGFISVEHGGVELPNPDASLVKPNSANNKIYSEIYM
ncbi:hypothetical protein OU798_01440 [Prolixibacteraceae bacterium Z1-6]|uniref:Uncharacterized protein n=1 Tax=Draconibacterium aestuarii TaxID=2998507 RepID=A0A9X3F9Y0_9BACT|nr:hypothetical protein [Prolixibacteraceae bacterium Z1-6]